MTELGSLVGVFIVAALVPILIGVVQGLRTGSRAAMLRTMRSWWAIGLGALVFLLSLFARYAQRFS